MQALDDALAAGVAFNQTDFEQRTLLPFELAWQQRSGYGNGTAFRSEPFGDAFAVAQRLYDKYGR